jgi:hypothetical protein
MTGFDFQVRYVVKKTINQSEPKGDHSEYIEKNSSL